MSGDRLGMTWAELAKEVERKRWEYRNVGDHEWRFEDGRCDLCGTGFAHLAELEGCPSKRERRRVGPWEPAPEETP